MMTIKLFLDNYPRIISILNKHGFHNAIIFKGFCASEEHNLNILIEDNKTKQEPRIHRKVALHDDLDALLKCKIDLATEDEMEEYYLRKLDSTNSVALTNHKPIKAIEQVFGMNWNFNAPDQGASFWFTPKRLENTSTSFSETGSVTSQRQYAKV